jgi:hypothetical protein
MRRRIKDRFDVISVSVECAEISSPCIASDEFFLLRTETDMSCQMVRFDQRKEHTKMDQMPMETQ